jgi:hypothetical protein
MNELLECRYQYDLIHDIRIEFGGSYMTYIIGNEFKHINKRNYLPVINDIYTFKKNEEMTPGTNISDINRFFKK